MNWWDWNLVMNLLLIAWLWWTNYDRKMVQKENQRFMDAQLRINKANHERLDLCQEADKIHTGWLKELSRRVREFE